MPKKIHAAAKPAERKIIAIGASVSIIAAEGDAAKGPRAFSSEFYTGGAMNIEGWDLPVVVDLAGLKTGKVLVANLDHDATKRVGNFELVNDGKSLIANGKANAATAARDEVVNSALEGYQWQASLEVTPHKVEELGKGKTANVNGQEVTGPAYITRSGTLKGFGFVTHGADDNTTATIAATAASSDKGKKMDPKLKAWIEAAGFDVADLSDVQLAGMKANFEGKNGKPAKITAEDPFEARKIEAKRKAEIREFADRQIDIRGSDFEEINEIEKMCDHAIEAGMSSQEFRLKMYESNAPEPRQIRSSSVSDNKITASVMEAAICQAGRLADHEKMFDDRTLQMAHDQFKGGGIGLKQLFLMCAEANGWRGSYSSDVTPDVLRAAFKTNGDRPQIRGQIWSYLNISTILSNVANKFLSEGWMAVDMTPLRIAAIRNVRNFQAITTVSLTGDLMFEELGAAGEIKHGKLGNISYSNQADTYAKMLAITRKDIINDDLGALTAVPRRLGRGSALKLNDIFWTAFLYGETSGFFSATHTTAGNTGNANLNTGAADVTLAGIAATETMFLNQVDMDGKPLGTQPAIWLVPTAQKNAAAAILAPQSRLVTGASATLSDVNVFSGRYRLESSPYLHNTGYTGYSTTANYLMADPMDLPTIEIAALNGRVEPVVETAEADFNALGVQMRGYSDVGVALQEYRACVKADGGAS